MYVFVSQLIFIFLFSEFRKAPAGILVATDVAARGLGT